MERRYYPVALDLAGRQCLVVGGGTIAADKVEGLLAAGAGVTVVSPTLEPRLERLVSLGSIVHHRRGYRSSDLDGVYLTYGATDNLATNAQVAADARAMGILANAVDDPPNCDFFAVAVVRRGDLQVAISTNGQSPAFARWMREHLEASLPSEYGDLLAMLAGIRKEMKGQAAIPPYEAWKAAITDDVLLRVRDGDLAGAHQALIEGLAARPDDGTAPARLAAVEA